jgi:hypothetical protein
VRVQQASSALCQVAWQKRVALKQPWTRESAARKSEAASRRYGCVAAAPASLRKQLCTTLSPCAATLLLSPSTCSARMPVRRVVSGEPATGCRSKQRVNVVSRTVSSSAGPLKDACQHWQPSRAAPKLTLHGSFRVRTQLQLAVHRRLPAGKAPQRRSQQRGAGP